MPKKKAKVVESIASSSEDEWEDVAESCEPAVNNDSDVQIQVDLPNALSKHSCKMEQAKDWIMTLIKRAINKSAKEIQIRMHKAHLLCLLCVGMRLNQICLDEELQCIALSLIDASYVKLTSDLSKDMLKRLISHVREKFTFDLQLKLNQFNYLSSRTRYNELKLVLDSCTAKTSLDLILVFILTLRSLGVNCRLVMSFQPIPLKPLTEKQKQAKSKKIGLDLKKAKIKAAQSKEIEIPQLDGATDDSLVSRNTRKSKKIARDATAKSNSKRDSLDSNKENNSTRKKQKSKTENERRKITKRTKSESVSKYVFSGDESSKSLSEECIPPAKKISTMADQNTKQSTRQRRRKTAEEKLIDRLERDVGLLNSDYVPKNIPEQGSSAKVSKTKTSRKQKAKTEPSDDNAKLIKKAKTNERNMVKAAKSIVSVSTSNATETKNRGKQGSRLRTARKNYAEKSDDDFTSGDNSDEDFDFDRVVFGNKDIKPKSAKKSRKSAVNVAGKTPNKSNLASKSSRGVNQWLEVYLEKVGWVVVDCIAGCIVDPKSMEENASKPIQYVVAFDNNDCIKDVTVRYASDWLITTRKLRVSSVDQCWWKETLNPFKTNNQEQDEEENEELEMNLLSQPLPSSISAFKNHPLFALRRHLLKYEAIYPPDTPSLGFIRGEEVLPRSSVHVLHTREKWLQSALSVKSGETPFKMVASYLLNKKLNRDSDAPSLALFGKWQTEPYQPPVARDGKVPRNEYGNVDLFQPSMLPIGCVQLRLPSLNVVARKLNIDVATAIVGFDTHHGYPHPVTDGYVVCKEHEAILKEAWEQEQAHAEQKAREKLEKRVYSNWKILIRGLLALQKVRKKYSDKADEPSSSKSSEVVSSTAWQAEKLKEAKERFESKGRRRRKK